VTGAANLFLQAALHQPLLAITTMYAMGATEFDLVETISDLLRRIDEGRETVRLALPIYAEFRKMHAERERLAALVKERQPGIFAEDDDSKRKVMMEIELIDSERRRASEEANETWGHFNKSISFLGPFSDDVLLLLQRLPLKQEWDLYRQHVKPLNVREHNCWTDTPENQSLDILEMRLREMLDLGSKTQRKQLRRVEPFPTPPGALWKDVTITFISEHRVQIFVLDVTETRNYAEMGFEDRRGGGGKPDSAWECLRALARSAGMLQKPVRFGDAQWKKTEKQIGTIKRRLKELFSIQADPLSFRKPRAYEVHFTITTAKSIDH